MPAVTATTAPSTTTQSGDEPVSAARAAALEIAAQRRNIDGELSAQHDVLASHNADLNTPLIDNQGFPRADIDIVAVRSARARIVQLRNDRHALDARLAELLADALPRSSAAANATVTPTPAPADSAPLPAAAAATPTASSTVTPATASDPRADHAVGTCIPPATAHAVSVSLPKWQDNVDYEEGRLADIMETGYPRFFVHRIIQRLAALLLRKFATPSTEADESEMCLLVSTARNAARCREFILAQHAAQAPSTSSSSTPSIRIVAYRIPPAASSGSSTPMSDLFCGAAPSEAMNVHIVLFPARVWPIAKSFWQHTGDGISSRFAQDALARIDADVPPTSSSTAAATPAVNGNGTAPRARNRHYARARSAANIFPAPTEAAVQSETNAGSSRAELATATAAGEAETAGAEHNAYVEERYARTLPASLGALAKVALRRRIAGTLLADRAESAAQSASPNAAAAPTAAEETGESVREGTGLAENDVWLFATGMSAIFHSHQIVMARKRAELVEQGVAESEVQGKLGKCICFGFPYLDTLKILEKWGPGADFYGRGDAADMAKLESDLAAAKAAGTPLPIALYCEFPSNPLLRSPDLARLRQLADEYGFLMVIDETVGNFLNVEVLPYSDVVVSSLTKVFSGDTNVMGGSLVLNPKSKYVGSLRTAIDAEYEDSYYGADACVMERNSRNFARRVYRINDNAEQLADMLHDERGRGVIKEVYYPKYGPTREQYDACRRRQPLLPTAGQSSSSASRQSGFGGLLSITFESFAAASAFFDALPCAKGPSLGTSFTLATPYAIVAHYTELPWAEGYGVDRNLVRVSTGLEDPDELLAGFARAIIVARRASRAARAPTATA